MSARYEGTSNLSSSSSEDDDIFEAHRRLITQAIYGNNQKRDGVGKLGLSGLQKMTVAFRILTYGVPADATDEYIKIGESTSIESVKRFCRTVVEVFGGQYLRSPNANDVARLLHIGEHHGFPGIAPPTRHVIQGKEYNMGYYLADDIYPKWSTLVQIIQDPRGPSRFWQKNIFHDIMTSCIIMHNMIIENERDMNTSIVDQDKVSSAADVDTTVDDNTRFQKFLARYEGIKNKNVHFALRNTLIEHLWEQFGNSDN
ncbi:uncharacterized protein LOC122001932 [Zingiber officinale]|uniref:uncharacterized protein LOC122001932 n=1 Tax=Zingiber officinale TaxID=94328 RepID=UPI001C4B8BA9|nr:uncharacterized protein LOC122001932 [Zingiber officinale]